MLAALASRAKASAVARAVARLPSNAGSGVATARSNQRRTWIGGAPSGGGASGEAGRGVGRASASAAGAVRPSGGVVRGGHGCLALLAGLGGFGRFGRARVPEIAMPDKGTYRAYEAGKGGRSR